MRKISQTEYFTPILNHTVGHIYIQIDLYIFLAYNKGKAKWDIILKSVKFYKLLKDF